MQVERTNSSVETNIKKRQLFKKMQIKLNLISWDKLKKKKKKIESTCNLIIVGPNLVEVNEVQGNVNFPDMEVTSSSVEIRITTKQEKFTQKAENSGGVLLGEEGSARDLAVRRCVCVCRSRVRV